MKLIGNLKKKVENAKTKEEAKDAIKKAGMLLDDDELDQVSGGGDAPVGGGGENSTTDTIKYGSIWQLLNGHEYRVSVGNEVIMATYSGKDQLEMGTDVKIVKDPISGWKIIGIR